MWIFPSSPSAPARRASTSASASLCHELALWATWKGKSRLPQFWRRACETEPSMSLLFGPTFEHSTRARSATAFIASLPVIRANPSPELASAAGSATRAICGPTSLARSNSASPSTCSSKTSKDTSALDSARWPASYARWATRARQESLARRKWARRTFANACSAWPTARAEDAESCGNHRGRKADSLTAEAKRWKTPHGMVNMDRHGKVAGGGGEFAKQAMAWSANWQTPQTDSFRTRGGDRKNEPGLDQQARRWPTPDAVSSSGGARSRSPKELDALRRGEQLGRNHRQMNLSDEASLFPRSRRGPKSSTPGASSSDVTPRLNPRFVELLMGLIPGWTACAPLETASFRWWRLMHSSVLRGLFSRGAPNVSHAAA